MPSVISQLILLPQAPGSNVDAIGAAALLPEDFLLKSESEARGGNSDSAPTESGQIVVLKRKRDQSIMPDGATDDDIESQAGESADEGDAEGFSSGEEESDAGMPQNGNETAGETGSGSSSPKDTQITSDDKTASGNNKDAESKKKEDKTEESEEITVEIKKGEVCRQLAEELEQIGMVEDAETFRKYMQQLGYDDRIRVGTYTLKRGMTAKEIAETFVEEN